MLCLFSTSFDYSLLFYFFFFLTSVGVIAAGFTAGPGPPTMDVKLSIPESLVWPSSSFNFGRRRLTPIDGPFVTGATPS